MRAFMSLLRIGLCLGAYVRACVRACVCVCVCVCVLIIILITIIIKTFSLNDTNLLKHAVTNRQKKEIKAKKLQQGISFATSGCATNRTLYQ